MLMKQSLTPLPALRRKSVQLLDQLREAIIALAYDEVKIDPMQKEVRRPRTGEVKLGRFLCPQPKTRMQTGRSLNRIQT